MSYSGLTKHFRLPYMLEGDVLTEEGETARANILDNLLYVLTLGVPNCIINEGTYSVVEHNQVNFLEITSLYGASFVGVLKGRLCFSNETLYSPALTDNELNYVYVEYSVSLEEDSSGFVVAVDDVLRNDVNSLLVATIDLTNNEKGIDKTTNKKYSGSINAHLNKNINPHGNLLKQAELECEMGSFNNISLAGNDLFANIYVKLETTGATGTDWGLEGYTPVFATVYGEESIGEVYWVINENVLTIKNTGAIGIPINVKIDVIKE